MKSTTKNLCDTAARLLGLPLPGLALAAVAFAWTPTVVLAQTVTPESINIDDASPVCNDDSITGEVCIQLPPDSVSNKVDVFFLFDDTGSFAGFTMTVAGIFQDVVTGLQTALPAVDFGFGVGRFEDYGGPGNGFSFGESEEGRPFILNQPIVTESDAVAGGTTLNDLIVAALGRPAPGNGADLPESSIAEGLFQVATGIGFDGDGDGSNTGSGAAGAVSTQTTPGTSGDVPAFSTLDPTVISSGSVGGAGYRDAALRLVILSTDVCSVAAFSADEPIPATIVGSGSEEPTSVYACSLGLGRFGFVSDSKTSAGNTVVGAVAPAGAGTVPDAIAALNAAGIRVLGLAPGGAPTDNPGPSNDPSVFLSALARTTGAVGVVGDPLVFDIGSGGDPLIAAIIVAAIEETVTLPIDLNLMASEPLPGGAGTTMVNVTPSVVSDVAPGEIACFDAIITGTDSPMGDFELRFKDDASGAVLGTIPVGLMCMEGMESETSVDIKPTSCPNPFRLGEAGVLPAAILGSDTLNVADIDPTTVQLSGPGGTAAPLRWSIEDVAAPDEFLEPELRDDCGTVGPDGFDDLTLKFDAPEVEDVLGPVSDGDVVILTISAETTEGASISGVDVVWIRGDSEASPASEATTIPPPPFCSAAPMRQSSAPLLLLLGLVGLAIRRLRRC